MVSNNLPKASSLKSFIKQQNIYDGISNKCRHSESLIMGPSKVVNASIGTKQIALGGGIDSSKSKQLLMRLYNEKTRQRNSVMFNNSHQIYNPYGFVQ